MAGFLVTSGADNGDLEAWGAKEYYTGFLKHNKKYDFQISLDSKLWDSELVHWQLKVIANRKYRSNN